MKFKYLIAFTLPCFFWQSSSSMEYFNFKHVFGHSNVFTEFGIAKTIKNTILENIKNSHEYFYAHPWQSAAIITGVTTILYSYYFSQYKSKVVPKIVLPTSPKPYNNQKKNVLKTYLEPKKSEEQIRKEKFFKNLFQLSTQKNSSELKNLIKKHLDLINEQDDLGNTPLHYLCQTNDFDIVHFLIKNKKINNIDINIKNKQGSTPLHVAWGHDGLIKLLVKNDADVTHINNLNASILDLTLQSLHYSKTGGTEIVNFLLANGAELNKETIIQELSYFYENTDLFELLLEKALEDNLIDYGTLEVDVVFKAIIFGLNTLAKTLIHKIPYIVDYNGNNILLIAITSENKEIVNYILDNFSRNYLKWAISSQNNLFEEACNKMTFEILRKIVKYTKLNSCNSDNESALQIASRSKNAQIVLHLCLTYPKLINTQDSYGRTPLMHAVQRNNNPEIVQILLSFGADLNLVDDSNNSAYSLAMTENNPKLIELINKYSKHPPIQKPKYQRTTNEYLSFGDIRTGLFFLQDCKNEDQHKLVQGLYTKNKKLVENALESGLIDERIDEKQRTPLMYIIKINDDALIKCCMKHNPSINLTDKDGNPALHYAAEYGNPELIVKLIKAGAEVEQKNKNGETPLHVAVIYGKYENTKTLLKYGAQAETVESTYGETALITAIKNKKTCLAKLLIAHGAKLDSKDNLGTSVQEWGEHIYGSLSACSV